MGLDEASRCAVQIESLIGDALLLDALRSTQDFMRDFAPPLRDAAVKLRRRYDAVTSYGLGSIEKRLDNHQLRQTVLDLVYDGLRYYQLERGSVTAPETTYEHNPDLPVIRADKLVKRFSRTAFSLNEISFELHAGEIMGVVGINGAGKTTLLRMATGSLAIDGGSLSYPAIAPALDWRRIKTRIAYVPQQPDRWYGSLRANLNFVAAAYRRGEEDVAARVEWVLARYDLGRYEQMGCKQLSGGYKTRYELARAMLSRPLLLVLDEPLAALDVIARQRFLEDLRSIARAKDAPVAIMVTSQHIHEIESVADRMLLIDNGSCAFAGTLADIERHATSRVLEIYTRVPRGDLEVVLEPFGLRHIEVWTEGYIVRCSRVASLQDVFDSLALTFGTELTGMRDVSRSSRPLLAEPRA